MNGNEIEMLIEERKLVWREEARARALEDLKAEGLTGDEERFEELYSEHYAELERLGLENIQ